MKSDNTPQGAEHTPTPWEHLASHPGSPSARLYHNGPTGYATIAMYLSDANAAHIVHCVNHHAQLVEALQKIADWSEFPPAEFRGKPCSYSFAYGSNGERDHMRSIARAALNAATATPTAQKP